MIVIDPNPQLAKLDATVQAMDKALAQTQAQNTVRGNVPVVRTQLVNAWQTWRPLYTAARAKPIMHDDIDKLTKRVLAWAHAFAADGVQVKVMVFPAVAGGRVFNVATGFDFLGTRIMTPSAISAELDKAASYIKQIDLDAQANAAKFPQDVAAWNILRDEFTTWHDAKPSTFWGATADKADEYIKRATDFRDRFAKLGIEMHGTAAPSGASPPGAWTPVVEKLSHDAMIGLGILAGIVIVPQLISSFGRGRSITAGL